MKRWQIGEYCLSCAVYWKPERSRMTVGKCSECGKEALTCDHCGICRTCYEKLGANQMINAKEELYREAIFWIAANDNPGSAEALNPKVVAGYLTVVMTADLFGVKANKVARSVVELRELWQ